MKPKRPLIHKRKKNDEVVNAEIVLREAPVQAMIDPKDIISPSLNAAQLKLLTGRTPEWAVKTRQGKGGRTFKYVPHGYVTSVLNKVFGFDWDFIIDPMSEGKMYAIEYEPKRDGTSDRHVAVTGHLTIRIHGTGGKVIAEITKSGFGSQMWLPTMEFGDALKGARSDLLKTCAFQLGIALDLYWNERAELDEYIKVEMHKIESAKVKEQFSGTPNSLVILLSRSQAIYGLDADAIAEIVGVSVEELMAASPEDVDEYWMEITTYAKNNPS